MQASWGLPGDGEIAGPAPVRVAEGSDGGVMGGTGRREDPALAHIYPNEVHDPKESEIQGRPVFKTVPYIRIMCPGDQRNIVCRPVSEQDKRRFPAVWQAFEQRKEGLVEGTPIEEFPLLTRRQVAVLKHLGIMTVEGLAGVTDDRLTMDVTRELRTRAQQFLAGADETERQLRAEIRQLREERDALAARMDQMQAALERLQRGAGDDQEMDAMPKKGGRRKKAA